MPLFFDRGQTYKIGSLKKKCQAALTLNCDTVVVPLANASENGGICNGIALKGANGLKDILHYAFKDGEEEEGERL